MDDHGNAVKLHGEYSGPIGSNPHYEKTIADGNLITDPSTFDFDEELKKPGAADPKYHQILEIGDFIVEESYKDADKFRIIDLVDEILYESDKKNNPEIKKYKPTKVHCYQCLNVHTIGKYIVFPGWDYIVYFNIKTKKVKKEHIR